MNDSHRGPNWKPQAEKLLASLRDIVGASLVLSPEGEITEVSILAEGHRPPKQIVRDVRAALRAEYRIDLDYRRISVAQKSPVADAGPTRPTVLTLPAARVQEEPVRGRPRFVGVTTHLEQSRCRVRVELALGEREALGEAEGTNARRQIPRLVAEATLEAVGRFLDGSYRLSLADLEVMRFGGEEIVLVGVRFHQERGETVLTGSAVVSQDVQQSVVYATLDGLNRILGRLRYKEPVEFELRPTTLS